MKKDSRVAVTGRCPRNSPAEMVAPDRETPGTSEKHWTSPMTSPSREGDLALATLQALALQDGVPLSATTHHGAPGDERGGDDPQAAQRGR